MKNRKTFNIILFISLVFVLFSCQRTIKTFDINSVELIKLLEDTTYSQKFIKSYQLQNCSYDNLSKRYCYEDSLIVYNIVGDGFILSLTNISVYNINELINHLENEYNEVDLREAEGAEKFIGRYNLDYAKYFYNDTYGVTIGRKKKEGYQIFVISVSRE